MVAFDLMVIVVYFLVMIFVGITSVRKIRSKTDYLVAGKRLNYGLYIPAMSAVVLGGASTLGGSSLGYQHGISGMWLVFMIGLGIVGMGLLFAKPLGTMKILSVSELLWNRFGPASRYFSAAVMAVYDTMVAVTSIIAMGVILRTLFGWDTTISILIGGVVVLFYTVVGGMWAVTLTDVVQFWIMTIGLILILLPMGLIRAGGYESLQTRLDPSFFSLTSVGIPSIFSYFLLYFFGMMIGQDIWQRALTAKSGRVLKLGTIISGIYCIIYAISGALIGMSAKVLLPNLSDPQQALPQLAVALLPHGLLGVVFAAVAAAVMSTASGTLMAASTILVNDILLPLRPINIQEKLIITYTRITTILLGLSAIGIGTWLKQIVVALDVAYALLSGSIFIPVVAAFFWKRVSAQVTIISMVLSAVVVILGLIIEGLSSLNPIIYGIVCSVLVMLIGSILGRDKTSATEQA